MANRESRFLIKRSNVPNKIPLPGDLLLGELGLNTADGILYTSGTTQNEILPIGWDRVHRTGDTMTGNLILSGASLLTPDYIDFNTNYTGNTIVEGRMYWDEPNGTISLGMHGGNVLQQIGLEYYYYIKNQSGATIENGRVVRASGTLGSSGRILGEYMIADGSIDGKYTLGIATENITDGEDGYVTEFGLVRGINTTGSLYGETWSDGDILWVSPTTPGGLTNVEPQAPNLKIEMAIVILADSNGSIFVRPHRYPYLKDLQGIIISGETSKDILQYNGGFWENTNSPTFNSLSANTLSATTFYGDGSNLTGISSGGYKTFVLTGGTSYTFTDFNVVNVLSVNKTTSSPTTVVLNQTPTVNEYYIVKDRKGDSNTNPITISGGTYTIDGNNTVQLKQNNKPSLTFLFDGFEYIII
jgi:hypothetical protein